MPSAKPASKSPTRPARPTPVGDAVQHRYRGLDDWIEVFTVGDHTDSQGRARVFSQADLDQMVANVSGAGVPAVLGHPDELDRAFGWGRLKRDGNSLLALFSDIAPAFRELVDAGAYRERSISTYKDKLRGWVVNHIGWLGAVPPALALRPLAYRRGDAAPGGDDLADAAALPAAPAGADLLEFAAGLPDAGWALGDVARSLRSLRDWLIEKEGLETADRVLSDWAIASIDNAGRRLADAAAMAESAPFTQNPTPQGASTMSITEADLQRARDEAAAAAEQRVSAEFTAQMASQGQQLLTLQAERRSERIAAQIAAWKAGGQLLPADEPGLAEFMAALEAGDGVAFCFTAPAGGGEIKKTPSAWFAAYMAARKPIKLGGAPRAGADSEATPVDTSDYRAVARKAEEWRSKEAAAGRSVSAAQAVAYVTSGAQV